MSKNDNLPTDPNAYYWVKHTKNKRYYIKASTRYPKDKPIAKGKISPDIIHLIKEQDISITARDIYEKLEKCARRSEFLKQIISESRIEHEPTLKALERNEIKYQKLKTMYDTIPPYVKSQVEGRNYDPKSWAAWKEAGDKETNTNAHKESTTNVNGESKNNIPDTNTNIPETNNTGNYFNYNPRSGIYTFNKRDANNIPNPNTNNIPNPGSNNNYNSGHVPSYFNFDQKTGRYSFNSKTTTSDSNNSYSPPPSATPKTTGYSPPPSATPKTTGYSPPPSTNNNFNYNSSSTGYSPPPKANNNFSSSSASYSPPPKANTNPNPYFRFYHDSDPHPHSEPTSKPSDTKTYNYSTSSGSYSYTYDTNKPKTDIPKSSPKSNPKTNIPKYRPKTNNTSSSGEARMPKNFLSGEHKSLLDEYNIKTKKDWRLWLIKNHPDKNPNTTNDLVQKIIEAGQLKFVT